MRGKPLVSIYLLAITPVGDRPLALGQSKPLSVSPSSDTDDRFLGQDPGSLFETLPSSATTVEARGLSIFLSTLSSSAPVKLRKIATCTPIDFTTISFALDVA